MTLTYELDPDVVKMNAVPNKEVTGHFVRQLFCKCTQTNTHSRSTTIPGPQKYYYCGLFRKFWYL